MKVAFDIAGFPVFMNGDLYYPGIASILAIIHCGGIAIIYNSRQALTIREKQILEPFVRRFPGCIVCADDDGGADMHIC